MLQDDPLARFFYETECIKGVWSVRELRRQIATNLYFRSGVSKDQQYNDAMKLLKFRTTGFSFIGKP